MRTLLIISLAVTLCAILNVCKKDKIVTSDLSTIEMTKYFDTEIFSPNDLKIYSKWKLFKISGGVVGTGYKPNFDYLEIKKFGIYGFIKNGNLLEYGKVVPVIQTTNEIGLKVEFVKDSASPEFFLDRQKYIIIKNDTLILDSPCCDRFNYHFKRVN